MTVCGNMVQCDISGVGHCWRSMPINADDMMELEAAMIDDGMDSCDSYRTSSGRIYRW